VKSTGPSAASTSISADLEPIFAATPGSSIQMKCPGAGATRLRRGPRRGLTAFAQSFAVARTYGCCCLPLQILKGTSSSAAFADSLSSTHSANA
jgi:hypothetical protein